MVDVKRDGDKIVVTFSCDDKARKAAVASKSGKTRVLASTNGFTRIGDVSISLNAILPLRD